MEYTQLAAKEKVETVSSALAAHNFKPTIVSNGAEALEFIKTTIPQGASIMNGASTTLQQIGFVDYLKAGQHGWNNLHETVFAEKDSQKQSVLRRQATMADFYLGSVHAITESAELIIASNSGSQLPSLAYNSKNLILIVSTKKIVPALQDAFDRIEKHIVPLEDARMKQTGASGTAHNKTLILHAENPASGRSVHVVLVSEDLGF